jgi:antagonist of KipI
LVEKPGILTTVQDLGRHGYRRFGINPGGVMDRTAARLINILLGNDESEAVIEMHFPAPRIIFEANSIMAIGGADFSPEIDGTPMQNWRPASAKKRSVLRFAGKESGNRAYLAVKGGFKIEKWLRSASTNLAASIGGIEGRKLGSGDHLAFRRRLKRGELPSPTSIATSLLPYYSRFPTVRIVAGAEFESLEKQSQKLLVDQDFSIQNNSNRMGFRLSGEPLSLSKPMELLSSAVSFGTIQLLPDGQLIVLMADHQTAGGYPRVAHVVSYDLPLLAQLGPGDKVAFHLVDHADAEQLTLASERELSFFRVGCKFQANS